MPVTIEISNTANLRRARTILGAKSNVETLELALEKVVDDHESKLSKPKKGELPDSYWDDLFSDPPIPSSVIIKAFDEEREDRF